MSETIKHYTASVFVFSDATPTKVLLQHHRKFDKWLAPGGHQDAWENPVEAAIRETLEETGLDISAAIPTPAPFGPLTTRLPVPAYFLEEGPLPAGDREPEHYHLDQIYIVRVPEQPARHDSKESHDIGWFTLEETESLPTFENVHLILRHEMKA